MVHMRRDDAMNCSYIHVYIHVLVLESSLDKTYSVRVFHS